MNRILDVYLHDTLAGILEQTDSGDLSFAYDVDYLKAAPHGLSLSLPLQSEPLKGGAFFSGLLPDESVRGRLAKHLGLSEKNSFALLEAVGSDCAGAVALYPHGHKPPESSPEFSKDVEILDAARLREVLDLIKRRPMLAGGDDGYRLSLAGAQDKLAVGFKDGHVVLVKGGTTHILKPIIERLKDSAHNELFCMKLARRVGLDVAEASLHFVGNTPYYLVQRYDRQRAEDGTITRLHQEDFCQALGIAPEMKYEREGGPSIAACQNVIAKHTARPAADKINFFNIVLFNYLVGNADSHGKNFSLLYKGNKPELAPAYDLLSTAIYPDLAQNMAMKIGGQYKPKDVYLKHFHKLLGDTKVAQSAMNRQIKKMTDKMMETASSLKADMNKDGLYSDVFDDIIAIIEKRARNIKQ